MAGSGTDKTKNWIERPGPVVILVEPQLGANIGAVARAMANFGLSRLRLVKPREGWPNPEARALASGANRVLDGVTLFSKLEDAIADCTCVLATTARAHDQAKPVLGADEAAAHVAPRIAGGETIGIVFGRERNGLENHEVGLADAILTLPVNPAFASLNLGHAVGIVAYEWSKHAFESALPFRMPDKSPPAARQQLLAFFDNLERELEAIEYFRPPEKRETMIVNLRNIFHRMQATEQDIKTLQGVIMALAEGRKGPARGGVLDGGEAQMLRTLLAEHGEGRVPLERGPVRGLSRLLRRNPTDAERGFWQRLVNDRRFAGRGFKRQVPIGPYIVDFVSFPLRAVIELIPQAEIEAAKAKRAARKQWLTERDYRVLEMASEAIEQDVKTALDELERMLGSNH